MIPTILKFGCRVNTNLILSHCKNVKLLINAPLRNSLTYQPCYNFAKITKK